MSNKLITIIGRGHSGTRAISHTLTKSGVFMGNNINKSGDLIPPFELYDACRVMSKHVKYLGNMKWDFSKLFTMEIDPEFIKLINSYLKSVLNSNDPVKGWKIPETTLIYPWITRLFPDIYYIFWVRDPRDSILGAHATDDLAVFNIPYDKTDNIRERRAISWKYQSEIFKATPQPKNLIQIRFEDFVLKQEETLKTLENYLELPLTKIEVRTDSVGRWKKDTENNDNSIFAEELDLFNYN